MLQPPRTLYPMGYHLTFVPYGSRLSGDPRGWLRRDGGGVPQASSPALLGLCAERLRFPRVLLAPAQIDVVHRSVVATCAHRAWGLHALTVQCDHAHVVLSAPMAPEAALRYLKSWATRALRREGYFPGDRPVWAEHGSTRYLHTEREVAVRVCYVDDDHHRASGVL